MKIKHTSGNTEVSEPKSFLGLKRLDQYIIFKFLGTFFFCIILIMAIVVVFDFNEKMDKFMNNDVPTKAIILNYYLNFIPYFGVKFSPLFVFISVIYFTSKMAGDSEIIAILASGVSFKRLVRPYMLAAGFLALGTFALNSYWLPHANKVRLAFEDQYLKKVSVDYTRHIQMEVEPGVILYIDRFDKTERTGHDIFIEKYKDKHLISRLTAESMREDSLHHWTLSQYLIRDFKGLQEHISTGSVKDTVLRVKPDDFFMVKGWSEQLSTTELKQYLDRQSQRGVGNIVEYAVEYHRRFSFPISAFILTLIGVALSSKKVRGGMGLNLGIGLFISFAYIMFDTVSGNFADGGVMSPFVSVWIPNFLFAIVGVYLYIKAPK